MIRIGASHFGPESCNIMAQNATDRLMITDPTGESPTRRKAFAIFTVGSPWQNFKRGNSAIVGFGNCYCGFREMPALGSSITNAVLTFSNHRDRRGSMCTLCACVCCRFYRFIWFQPCTKGYLRAQCQIFSPVFKLLCLRMMHKLFISLKLAQPWTSRSSCEAATSVFTFFLTSQV